MWLLGHCRRRQNVDQQNAGYYHKWKLVLVVCQSRTMTFLKPLNYMLICISWWQRNLITVKALYNSFCVYFLNRSVLFVSPVLSLLTSEIYLRSISQFFYISRSTPPEDLFNLLTMLFLGPNLFWFIECISNFHKALSLYNLSVNRLDLFVWCLPAYTSIKTDQMKV